MEKTRFKYTFSIFSMLIALIALPVGAQRQLKLPTDEQIKEQVPNGVTFVPNIAYREGNDAWKLDLAMPKERGG